MSRRSYLRASEKRGLCGLRMHDRLRKCWRRRWRTDWPGRQGFAARECRDFIASQRLAIEQCRCNSVQQLHVFLQHLRRARIRFLDHTRNLGVDQLRRTLGNFASRLQLAAEEKLLLVIAHEDRTYLVRQSPLRHVPARETSCLL